MKPLTDKGNKNHKLALLFLQRLIYTNKFDTFIEIAGNNCYTIKNLICDSKVACFSKEPPNEEILNHSNTLVGCCKYSDIGLPNKPVLIYCATPPQSKRFYLWCNRAAQNGNIVVLRTSKPPKYNIGLCRFNKQRFYIYGGKQ